MSKKSKSSKKPFNGLWIFIGLVAISVVIGMSLYAQSIDELKKTDNQIDESKAELVPDEAEPKQATGSSEHERVDQGDAKRVKKGTYRTKAFLTTSGRASNAKWGVQGLCSFVLTYDITCDSEIMSEPEVTPGGEIKIQEKRTFQEFSTMVEVSKTDLRLDLFRTMPLDDIFNTLTASGRILLMIKNNPYTPMIGGGMVAVSEMTSAILKGVDGMGIRWLLGKIGIKNLPKSVEDVLNDFVAKKVKTIVKPSNLQGKTYLLTYYQPKNGPMRVDFKREDGTAMTESEMLVLRRANAFMHAKIIPDKNSREWKNDREWTFDASEMESVFDPYVDGSYRGEVTVKRLADDKKGNWVLSVQPCRIYIKSDEGRTTGELRIRNGKATADTDNVIVKNLVIEGIGRMKRLTKHHLLFQARFEGDCDYNGILITEEIKKDK